MDLPANCKDPAVSNTSSSGCCARCSIKLSRYCCDICNPAALQSRLFPSLPLPSTRAKHKFTIKPYEMTTRGHDLHQELLHWRDFKVLEEDLDGDNFFGPQIIMSNKILDRIIDLAHYSKIISTTALFEQTHWCYADLYGPEILKIIKTCIPLPCPPSPKPVASVSVPVLGSSSIVNQHSLAPNPQSIEAAGSVDVPSVKRPRKCSACGNFGHIGKCLFNATVVSNMKSF